MVFGLKGPDESKKYEGFDGWYQKLPQFGGYHIWLLCASGYLCIIAGLVQTGSVFLQAKPEDFRKDTST